MTKDQKKSKLSLILKWIPFQFKYKKQILYFVFPVCLLVLFLGDSFASKLSLVASIVALIVAWRAYRLQKKSEKDLKQIEENIYILKAEGQKIQKNVEQIKNTSSKMQEYVNKSYFQVERTTALNKYPDREEFKKINEAYLPFIFALFDPYDKPIIGIQIHPDNSEEDLRYDIEVVKNEINIPKKERFLYSNFYIIKILAPAFSGGLTEEDLQKYKHSPIKEGEYYACRFDQMQCSWILSQRLTIGSKEKPGFFKFYPSGSISEAEIVPSANEVMGYNQNKYPGSEYTLLGRFIVDETGNFPARAGDFFKLFKKENQVFFTINDSPLKEIYILKTWIHAQSKYFLVFENLRGYIKNQNFVENLKNRIFEKINWNDLLEKSMDEIKYEKNHHIKIPLENHKNQLKPS